MAKLYVKELADLLANTPSAGEVELRSSIDLQADLYLRRLARLTSVSRLNLAMRPFSKLFRRGWVIDSRLAASACVTFQDPIC